MAIAYQDHKERRVYLFLLIFFIIEGAALFLLEVSQYMFLIYSLINLSVLAILMGVLVLYSKYIMRKPFFKEAFGLGDLLFLFAMALSFATIEFLTFLVFSIFFSLLLHWVNRNRKFNTVPLAGYSGLFLCMVYVVKASNSYG